MENGKQVVDGNLEDIKKSLEGSLKRLKTDYIDLYYLHRVDPNVPIEDIAYLMKNCIKATEIKFTKVEAESMNEALSQMDIESRRFEPDSDFEKRAGL